MARSLRSALFLLVLLLLGCRTIGGEQRVVAAEREHERTADHELAATSIHAGAPDGMFAYTHPGQLPRLLVAGEGPDAMLPLKHTDVDARVRGHVAQVRSCGADCRARTPT